MAIEYDQRRPRIPVKLALRIDGARGQMPFDRFVREAVEAALGTPENGPVGGSPRSAARPPGPVSPRASVQRIGCAEHPEAGALRGSGGRWWCAETDCTNDAREVPA